LPNNFIHPNKLTENGIVLREYDSFLPDPDALWTRTETRAASSFLSVGCVLLYVSSQLDKVRLSSRFKPLSETAPEFLPVFSMKRNGDRERGRSCSETATKSETRLLRKHLGSTRISWSRLRWLICHRSNEPHRVDASFLQKKTLGVREYCDWPLYTAANLPATIPKGTHPYSICEIGHA
jgi:hypothetical protein